MGDVISRIGQIPRFLDQAKSQLTDADPIFISTAVDENEGNSTSLDTVAAEIPAGSPLKAQYDKVAPAGQAGAQRLQHLDEERSRQDAHQRPHLASGRGDGTRPSFAT